MARTKAVLGAGARLSDYLSASLLARVYPAEMVGEILDQHGCNSKRIRSLPAANTGSGLNTVRIARLTECFVCSIL